MNEPDDTPFTSALFTAQELETVRRCCRDDDATAPLRALMRALDRHASIVAQVVKQAGTSTTHAVQLPDVPKTGRGFAGSVTPTEWHDKASAALEALDGPKAAPPFTPPKAPKGN